MPKGKLIHWIPAKIDELRKHASSGLTAKQCGARMGMSETSAQSAASKFGIRFNGKVLATWPDHVVEELRRLADEGMSGRQIAIELGISRGAVMGKSARLGILLHGSGSRSKGARSAIARIAGPAKPKPPKRPVQAPEVLFCEPVSLIDLEKRHCRFPVSGEGADTMFCGAPTDDKETYCAGHRWRCSTPPLRAVKAPREFRLRACAA